MYKILGALVAVAAMVATATPAMAAPPTADSGPNIIVEAGTDAVLSGTASDPDGDALEIRWLRSVISGGNLASCTFSGPIAFEPISPAGLAPTFNCTQPGDYLLQLVAADGTSSFDDTGTVITFTPFVNEAPDVDSGPSVTVPAGTDALLAGTATDPDGDALEIRWIRSVVSGGSLASCTFTGPTAFTPISAAGLAPTLNCIQPGEYLLQLVAGDGTTSVDDIGALITFTENPNEAPIVDSGPNVTTAAGTDAVLAGTASDPDGDPLEIRWIRSVVSGGNLATCTFTGPTAFTPISAAGLAPTLNCTQPGEYLLQLVAGDGTTSVDDIGALVTFTDPIDDFTAPQCSAAKRLPGGGLLIRVNDPQSGVSAIRGLRRLNATVLPNVATFSPAVTNAYVTVSPVFKLKLGVAQLRVTNGDGIDGHCLVVIHRSYFSVVNY